MFEVYEFDLARDCLRYLVKRFGIKEMYIPYYLCDTVRHTLVEVGCKPLFYHIDDDFFPKFPVSPLPAGEGAGVRGQRRRQEYKPFILYPNYFGICGENVKKLARNYSKLIVDNAHAYYDEPMGFACFNAGHKFGFEKSRLWIKTASAQNEIQKEIVPKSRRETFLALHQKYSDRNLLNIDTKVITAPFVYPCLLSTIEEADILAKELKSEGKTIYRYWNPLPESYSEYKFYSRLVPIPPD